MDNKDKIERINSEFKKMCQQLSSYKMLLTHRDYHSRNIMVHQEQKIVIDFQDARQGIAQYDLVSLLEDCYYLIGDKNKSELINYYTEKIGLKHIGQDINEFQKNYDLMAIQRIYKAIGSFSFIYKGRKDLRYVKYIGFAMERLKQFLDKYSE